MTTNFIERFRYDSIPDGKLGMLAVVLAPCSTDRVELTDKELVNELRVKKGTTLQKFLCCCFNNIYVG